MISPSSSLSSQLRGVLNHPFPPHPEILPLPWLPQLQSPYQLPSTIYCSTMQCPGTSASESGLHVNPSTPSFKASGGHSQKSKPGTKPYLSPSFQMLALLDPHVIHLPSPFLKANSTSGTFCRGHKAKAVQKVVLVVFFFILFSINLKQKMQRIELTLMVASTPV